MGQGGKLVIQTTSEKRHKQDWIIIRVRDQGPGIPEEIIQHVFEPFFTTKPVGSGTGLGLSISSTIVSEHGGTLEVESKEGEGACFSVWLPIPEVQEQS
jgi:signal transduction histidine kinase